MSLTAGTQKQRKSSKVGSQKAGKRWVVRPAHEQCAQLAKSLKISPLLAQVLINRGICDAGAGTGFLGPKLTDLVRPEYMPGIADAAAQVKQAVQSRAKITIYGDYDVDGITGVAILWQLLKMLGADVDYYIPHRVDEGYGLNEDAVRSLAEAGTKLLVTVDCGITALNSAQLAHRLGLKLIVTDHHQPGEKLPEASAIVHPALDDSYPNQDSSGAMVAFKLAWAIANEFSSGTRLESDLREFMLNAVTLAAMGTIADVVDVRGENRILTTFGLKALPECKLCGVRALIDSANLTGRGLDSYHIGFRLAPMLNAAGRMGHARLAVELLTGENEVRSAEIAEYLKQQNTQRQKAERKIFDEACQIIAARGLDKADRRSIVLADSNWHTGIIGIVASRIAERFHRPAIMINSGSSADEVAQGSGRSIHGFSLLDAICACSRHLVSFGGHKMAAGLTIETGRIDPFAADFEHHACRHLSQDDVVEKLYIDAVAPLNGLRREVVEELRLLEPFGQANPRPTFATMGVRLATPPRRVGARGEHLQLAVSDNTTALRCVGFRLARFEKQLLDHEFFNVAYQPQINTYNGNSSVELVINDIQFE